MPSSIPTTRRHKPYCSVPIVSVTVGITLGALWGIITGYFGGAVDSLSQRLVDTLALIKEFRINPQQLTIMAKKFQSVFDPQALMSRASGSIFASSSV